MSSNIPSSHLHINEHDQNHKKKKKLINDESSPYNQDIT